jgi:hypothetical protein
MYINKKKIPVETIPEVGWLQGIKENGGFKYDIFDTL